MTTYTPFVTQETVRTSIAEHLRGRADRTFAVGYLSLASSADQKEVANLLASNIIKDVLLTVHPIAPDAFVVLSRKRENPGFVYESLRTKHPCTMGVAIFPGNTENIDDIIRAAQECAPAHGMERGIAVRKYC